jgi:hypothetical protein
LSIKGSSHARFLSACRTGNPLLVRASAAELGHLSLADALRVTLVLARAEPASFPRVAARWVARFADETAATLPDVALAAAALAQLPAREDLARETLAGLAEALHADALLEVLDNPGVDLRRD